MELGSKSLKEEITERQKTSDYFSNEKLRDFI